VGSVFHIGKQFYDFTIWTACDQMESLATIADYAQRTGASADELYNYKSEATKLNLWITEYAIEVGLNPDVK
jgi:hypothetical protein